ncbi:hypothetical protein HMPREF1547_03040 [Blautia sp. KLE 1732]|nr:hypothetical protein HMPREF1547_03040 [Blautia sp. KLE 1732]
MVTVLFSIILSSFYAGSKEFHIGFILSDLPDTILRLYYM